MSGPERRHLLWIPLNFYAVMDFPGNTLGIHDQLDLRYFANGTSWLRCPRDDISWPIINIQCAFWTVFGLRHDVIRSAVKLELRILFVMAGQCEVFGELQSSNATPKQSIHACVNDSCNRIWPWTAGQCAATGAQEPPGLC